MIDTNVVLDLLHFDDAVARPLRLALEAGRVRCVVSPATLDELQRVLAYVEFGLDAARQAVLFARYRALSEMAQTVEGCTGLPHQGTGLKPVWNCMPRCSDPDDQMFIELAASVRAQGLVSKDRAVLKLRRRCAPQFLIMRPDEAVRWLAATPG